MSAPRTTLVPTIERALVVSVRVHTRGRAEQDARQRVRDHQHRLQRRAVRERVHEDEQREHEELVGELRGELRAPEVAEIAAAQHRGESLPLLRGRGVAIAGRDACSGATDVPSSGSVARAASRLPHRVTDLTSATARARSSHSSRRSVPGRRPGSMPASASATPAPARSPPERPRHAVAQGLAARLEERLGDGQHRRADRPVDTWASARS